MPVTDIHRDFANTTLTITAEFDAPVERVWQLYADPRQLEKVWGPPTHPATFEIHDLRPGGRAHYFMTGPDGKEYFGFWEVTEVNEPNSFAFDDAFSLDDSYTAVPGLPVGHNVFSFEPIEGGTRATYATEYDSEDDLTRVLEMGIEEGATVSINQIDGFLAAN